MSSRYTNEQESLFYTEVEIYLFKINNKVWEVLYSIRHCVYKEIFTGMFL